MRSNGFERVGFYLNLLHLLSYLNGVFVRALVEVLISLFFVFEQRKLVLRQET